MWLLTQFEWYRAWRKGSWARHSGLGLLWEGKVWFRLGPEFCNDAEEFYPQNEFWNN